MDVGQLDSGSEVGGPVRRSPGTDPDGRPRPGAARCQACLTQVPEGARVTPMVRLAWIVFLLSAPTIPAWAEDGPRVQYFSRTADQVRQLDLETGSAILNRLLSLADRYLQEHFDVDGEYRPDSSSDGGAGRFHFKWYPDGKSRSSKGFETDAWFDTLPHQFSFRFRFSEPRPRDDSSQGDIL